MPPLSAAKVKTERPTSSRELLRQVDWLLNRTTEMSKQLESCNSKLEKGEPQRKVTLTVGNQASATRTLTTDSFKSGDHSMSTKSETPACAPKQESSPATPIATISEPVQHYAEDDLPSGFTRRRRTSRTAIKKHIIEKGISKSGLVSGKVQHMEIPKEHRLRQLHLWQDEKLDQLEQAKNSKGTYRSHYPGIYESLKHQDDKWLRDEFSKWINAPEARVTDNGVSKNYDVEVYLDTEDQDDEESFSVKDEPRADDYEIAHSRTTAKGRLCDPSSSPETDYYVDTHYRNKRKLHPEFSSRQHNIKREYDSDSGSDEAYTQQPPKKYVAVGPENNFNGVQAPDQHFVYIFSGGKKFRTVARAWVWNEAGRMVVYPPFESG